MFLRVRRFLLLSGKRRVVADIPLPTCERKGCVVGGVSRLTPPDICRRFLPFLPNPSFPVSSCSIGVYPRYKSERHGLEGEKNFWHARSLEIDGEMDVCGKNFPPHHHNSKLGVICQRKKIGHPVFPIANSSTTGDLVQHPRNRQEREITKPPTLGLPPPHKVSQAQSLCGGILFMGFRRLPDMPRWGGNVDSDWCKIVFALCCNKGKRQNIRRN